MTDFEVAEDEAGQRLDVVLATRLEVSRSHAVSRIGGGAVTVDGAPAAKQQRLRAGQRVEVAPEDEAEPVAAPELPPVRYRDEHLLVVAKPPGLVVHPGAGHAGDTLVDALQAAGIPLAEVGDEVRPGIVHRLDRDTSGLLVVASSEAAHRGLVAQLAERQVTRRYVTLTVGVPDRTRGRVEGPIGRDPNDRTRFAVVASGRPAVTRYQVLASGSAPLDPPHPVSLLRCQLETGRTHQIRVHLTALGHPVVGDPVYGPRRAIARALGAARPMLHAAELGFRHPVTGEEVAVQEPLPADLREVCARAGVDADPLEDLAD